MANCPECGFKLNNAVAYQVYFCPNRDCNYWCPVETLEECVRIV